MTVEGVVALLGAGVGIFAAVGSYFKSKYDTENNKSKITELQKKWEDNTEGDSSLKDRVLTLEGEVKYMKGDLTEIKKELKQMMENQTDLAKLMTGMSLNLETLSRNVSDVLQEFKEYQRKTQEDIEKFYQINKEKIDRPI